MTRWFRVHDDLVDDPKVQLLSGDLVKSLLNLWCLASQNDGILPSMKDMAFKLRMKPQHIAATIAQLSAAGLIDQEGDSFRPHNWDKRQYKSDTDGTAAERSKRYRAKHRDGNAPVTRDGDRDGNACRERPYTEQIQITEQIDCAVAQPPKKSAERKSRKKPGRTIPDDFEMSPNNSSYAKSFGFSDYDIKRDHQKFRMHHRAKGTIFSDWDAAEHNWITKAAEFAGKRPRGEVETNDDGLVDVIDQLQLEAWDEYGRTKTGKPYPRNRFGGWRFPSKWPPGHEQKMLDGVLKLVASS